MSDDELEGHNTLSENTPLLTASSSSSGNSTFAQSVEGLIENKKKEDSLYRTFIVMCLAFSLNHGCVVASLAYATTILGDTLGGVGSGCLYVVFSLTSLLFAKPIVAMVGPKYGLLMGVMGYSIYVIGFLVSVLIPFLAWPVFVLASIIGGFAGGLLWPSQGRYFALNAKQYAEIRALPVEKVNATFAGIFATAYLGMELVVKVLATVLFLLFPNEGYYLVFVVYSFAAVMACFAVASLSELNTPGTLTLAEPDVIYSNVMAVMTLVHQDQCLALLLPFQVAFGLASSFVPYYIFGTVIADSAYLGETYVGLLSAVIVLVGSALALPAAWIANRRGKPILMITGGLCLALTGSTLFVTSDSQLGRWVPILLYLGMYGVGRGTWENTNKAVVADFYSGAGDHNTAAFAAVAFSSGFAGALGYFIYPFIGRDFMASLITGAALLGVVSYLAADRAYAGRDPIRAVVNSRPLGRLNKI